MNDQAAAVKRKHGLVGPLEMTLAEIRERGVPLRRSGEQILLGKNPPSDVVAFVKANKLALLFELAAEETTAAVEKLKPARVPTLQHEQWKADKDEAWKAMFDAFAKAEDLARAGVPDEESFVHFRAWDLARAKWVVACRKLADPESVS